jgi:hypothetical protein
MSLRESYENLTAKTINEWIASGREEDVQLDFKTISRADLSSRDDRKNLAIAVSGFANSSGGLIVWGVDARPNREGIDCASEAKPINDVPRFMSKFNEHVGAAASPIVDGVECRPVEGFAVTFVPESSSTPHMAKLGEDRYYKRSGSRFVVLEHFDLEDIFGRRPRPKLQIVHRLLPTGTMGGGAGVRESQGKVIVSLENVGKGVARAPYVAIVRKSTHKIYQYGLDGNGSFGLPRLVASDDSTVRYGGTGDTVIHPGVTREITAVGCAVVVERGEPRPTEAVNFSVLFTADGLALQETEVTYAAEQVFATLGMPR